ncbi:hypothetical protein MMPV_005812 [Pyropia vietnamensis]
MTVHSSLSLRRSAPLHGPAVAVAVLVAAVATAMVTTPTTAATGGAAGPASSPPPAVPAGYPLFPLALQPILTPAVRSREVPFVFRTTAAVFAAWWDCVVPYVDVRGGKGRVRDSFGRRPRVTASARASNVESMGVCAAAASAVLAEHLLSSATADAYYERAKELGNPLPRDQNCGKGAALRPDKAGCYGVAVARRLINDRLAGDGFNEAGTDKGTIRGVPNDVGRGLRRPFRDVVVGHTPVNSPWSVTRLLRWTPLEEDLTGTGTYVTQRITAPQASVARPYLLSRSMLAKRRVARPYPHEDEYAPDFTCGDGSPDRDQVCRMVADAARAVAVSASSMRRRALITHFDDKTRSLAPLPAAVAKAVNLSYPAFVAMEFAANGGLHDSLTAVWAEKLRHDAVRPATLVPRILPPWGGKQSPSGGGGGRRRGGHRPFEPTIRTMPHSEYPSGSACFCRVFTDALAEFVPQRGPWPRLSHTFPAGESVNPAAAKAATHQPGGSRPPPPPVPTRPLTVTWPSLRALADECSVSRLWGGLHFPAAVKAGEAMCDGLGAAAVQKVACMAKGVPGVPRCEEK